MLPYIRAQQQQGNIMPAFLKSWDDYAMVSKLLDRCFDYLNRFYLKGKNHEFLGVTAMKIFINNCFLKVNEPLKYKVLETFTQDRNGNVADK